MDSGDDMLDPIGDYYSDDEEENEFGYLDNADQGLQPKTSSFTVLKEPDILRRQEDLISKVCAVLSVSRVAASILLRHHHWSVSELHEAWFADEERVRKAVGLPESPSPESSPGPKTPIDCGICFESFPGKLITSASCRHPYCKGCWRNYISTAIESGPGCLVIRCPEPSCQVAIGQDMIDSLTLVKDRMKYAGFLLRSFVEESRKIKWCPAAGCENAVELEVGDEGYDVTCECSNGFCWNCNEEAHRPVDCETVAKWMIKNSSEAENTNWILANSKPCPKCKRPIEKNHGCMHMTCRSPCTYQFCWLCLGDWSGHGVSSCNKYAEANKADPAYNEAERRRVMAKRSIEKYTHYYERWAANHSSKQKALGDLSELENAKLGEISNLLNIPETQLKFISEAWVQIIECRRVLKWSYAYGYYLPEEENAKKQFFEYSQGEAEAGLERLHKCAEKDLKEYLKGDREEDFSAFRTRLVGLTKVTGTYFENLVRALENGLQEVTAKAGCSKIAESKPTKRQRFK